MIEAVKEFVGGVGAIIAIANSIGEPARWRTKLSWNKRRVEGRDRG